MSWEKNAEYTWKKRNRLEKIQQDLQQVFMLLDVDGSGRIDARTLHDLAKRVDQPMSREETDNLMAKIDVRGHGYLKMGDFVKILAPSMFDMYTYKNVVDVFHFFDRERRGRISFHNIKQVMRRLGCGLYDSEIVEMILEADAKDDEVNLAKFADVIKLKKS